MAIKIPQTHAQYRYGGDDRLQSEMEVLSGQNISIEADILAEMIDNFVPRVSFWVLGEEGLVETKEGYTKRLVLPDVKSSYKFASKLGYNAAKQGCKEPLGEWYIPLACKGSKYQGEVCQTNQTTFVQENMKFLADLPERFYV